MLARVLRIRNAVAELKVKGLQQAVAKEVTLDHAEIIDRLAAHGEFHTARKPEINIFKEKTSLFLSYVAPTVLRLRNAGVN